LARKTRARFLVPSRLHSRPNICLLPKSGTEFDDCDEYHKDPCGTSDTTTWLRARLRRTLLVWALGTPAKRWMAACSLRGSIPLSSARPSNQIGTRNLCPRPWCLDIGHARVIP